MKAVDLKVPSIEVYLKTGSIKPKMADSSQKFPDIHLGQVRPKIEKSKKNLPGTTQAGLYAAPLSIKMRK